MAPIDLLDDKGPNNTGKNKIVLDKPSPRLNSSNNLLVILNNNNNNNNNNETDINMNDILTTKRENEDDRVVDEDEEMIETSSASSTTESSFSSSSLSPLSSDSVHNLNNKIEHKLQIEEEINEDEKNSINNNDSPTPTPTPNESKANNEEKFNEFTSTSLSTILSASTNALNNSSINQPNKNINKLNQFPLNQINHSQHPSLPNSLSLKSNLNTSFNNKSSQILLKSQSATNINNQQLPQFTSQPPSQVPNQNQIYNPATTPGLAPYPLMYQNLATSPLLHPHSHPTFLNYLSTKSNNTTAQSQGINSQIQSDVSQNNGKAQTPSTVYVHVDAGHIFQVQLGDKVRDIIGPATVKIVNNDSTQPVPLQLTAPAPGQFVQQIVDENGMLIHLIISSHQPNQIIHPNTTGLTVQTNNNNIINSNEFNMNTQLNNSKNKNLNYSVNNNQNSKNSSTTSMQTNPYQISGQINSNSYHKQNYFHHNNNNSHNSNNYHNHHFSHNSNYHNHNHHQHHYNQHHHHHQNHYQFVKNISQTSQQVSNQQNQQQQINKNKQLDETNETQLLNTQDRLSENFSTSSCDLEENSTKQIETDLNLSESVQNSSNINNTIQSNSALSISPLSSSSCSSTSAQSTCNSITSSSSFNSYVSKSNDENSSYTNDSKTKKNTRLINNKSTNINSLNTNTTNNNQAINRSNNTKIFHNSNKKLNQSNSINEINFGNKIIQQQNYLNNQITTQQPLEQTNSNRILINRTTPNHKQLINHNNNNNYNSKNFNNNISNQSKQMEQNNNNNKFNFNKEDNQTVQQQTQDSIEIEIENNLDLFRSILSKIKKPIVSNIESQSVLVYLSPIELDNIKNEYSDQIIIFSPDIINKFQNLNYTLELSCETQHFNKVYTGDANEITLKDLKPNTKYFLRVFASLNFKCKGDYTNAVSFQTKPSQPDQPLPPKLTGVKKKNELTLKWTNPNENGSKILNFILEYQKIDQSLIDEATELKTDLESRISLCSYIQIYKGPLKQFIVKKLTPSTCYSFRLAAENTFGLSEFSKPAFIYTSGCVPNVPEPPRLIESTVSTISLQWGPKRQNENDYELQMLDYEDKNASLHGFLTVYNGPLLVYTVNDLKKCCSYQFRLRAKNEEGNSGWSDVRKYETLADIPKCPVKVRVKFQSGHAYKVNWESPKDDGGDRIRTHTLEMSEFDHDSFEEIYNGEETEYLIEKPLKPGYCYLLRVYCSNSIGSSTYSEVTSFTTQPIQPGKCLMPKLNGKPKSNSVQLKWNYPDEDGGSSILNYEIYLYNDLQLAQNENDKVENNVVYKGNELTCTIANLLPGRIYYAKLRCYNKVGSGPWSDILEFNTGAGCPDAPEPPIISTKSSNCLLINWSEPASNGSPIIEYRLEWSLKESDQFTQLYTGNALKYELKNYFLSSTKYFFKLQATNVNGSSQFSQPVEYLTPAGVPSIVSGIKLDEICSDSILITWKQPNTNGSPIQFYNIDFSETITNNQSTSPYIVLHQQECEYRLENLQPDTNYKLRIQAANCVGIGQFSNLIKFKTKALAPQPPLLECVSTSYNSIKLKWTSLINSNNMNISSLDQSSQNLSQLSSKISVLNDYQLVYNLEMMLEDTNDSSNDDDFTSYYSFNLVYHGPLNVFKVTKLRESSVYLFRISASNEAGQGKWSDIYRFSTTKSPPIINKAPTVTEISQTSCLIEWQAAKLSHSNSDFQQQQQLNVNSRPDSLEYCLQIQAVKKESDYREIYRGESCSYRLRDLEPNTEYNVRVCAVRLCYNGSDFSFQRICSPASPNYNFTTMKIAKSNHSKNSDLIYTNSSNASASSSNKNNSFFMLSIFFGRLNNNNKSKLHDETDTHVNSKHVAQTSKKTGSNRSSLSQQGNSQLESSLVNDSKLVSRRKSDQYWAFALIFILVLIAFLIAYIVSSYYEVASVQNTEF